MEFSFLQVSIAILALNAIAQTSLATHESDSSIKEFLAAHNAARATVGVPPVTWNATLATYAEAYAAKRSADCAPQHSQGPYGENIAEASAEISAAASVKLWLDEKANFDQASNTCVGGQCLHYTQLVWRNTKSIWCAGTPATAASPEMPTAAVEVVATEPTIAETNAEPTIPTQKNSLEIDEKK